MLSLGRNPGEYVVIGDNTIDAPKEMSIERGENYEKTHDVPECIKRTRMLGGAKRKH